MRNAILRYRRIAILAMKSLPYNFRFIAYLFSPYLQRSSDLCYGGRNGRPTPRPPFTYTIPAAKRACMCSSVRSAPGLCQTGGTVGGDALPHSSAPSAPAVALPGRPFGGRRGTCTPGDRGGFPLLLLLRMIRAGDGETDLILDELTAPENTCYTPPAT